jgi:6-phosphogluconolactonase
LSQRRNVAVSVFENLDALMQAAAEQVVTTATAALAARGRFTWALAGGSTPRRLYKLLASPPFVGRIDWDRVHFFWGDERSVPPDHADSNYRMARDTLLDVVHPPPANVHRMPGEEPPSEGAHNYEAVLRRTFETLGVWSVDGLPRFDLMLLGMGPDGHTASLFPGFPEVEERGRWVLPVHVDQTIASRMSLSLPVINAAAHVTFLVAGADKAPKVEEVLSSKDDGVLLPAARVRPTDGDVTWLLDAAAAASIDLTETNR